MKAVWWEPVSGGEPGGGGGGLIRSADKTQADVTCDEHKSFVSMAIIEATAEMETMATPSAMLSCASQRRH